MAYEHKEMSGALFTNKHKREDKHPDMRGEVKINGVVMEIAAWWKGDGDKRRLNINIKPKREQSGRQNAPEREPGEDIPF